MGKTIEINGRKIGPGQPTYIIAEMSANHNGSFERAKDILIAAKDAGADAVKLQTYRADTITLDCDSEPFQIKGTVWAGQTLYNLYEKAFTPWEWHQPLRDLAHELGMDLFSSPFDLSAVDFLEEMEVPVYKVASLEIVDHPLLRAIGKTGKPVIVSTGGANLAEIAEAVDVIKSTGNKQIALLRCVSAYPAPPEEMNLRIIPHLSETFDVPSGLSDHSMGHEVAVASVALGGSIIEKHFILSRSDGGPDSGFSMEPEEFKQMVNSVRNVEQAVGTVSYGITDKQKENVVFRRSLFTSQSIKKGEPFSSQNVKSVRPGHGLHPKYYDTIVSGKVASEDIKKGTPLDWHLLS